VAEREEGERPPTGTGKARGGSSALTGITWGAEFAGAIILLTFLGYWLDRSLGSLPWLTIVGAFVGFGLGLYAILRRAARQDRKKQESAARDEHQDQKD